MPQPQGPSGGGDGPQSLGVDDGAEPLISGPAVPGGGRVSFVISPSEAVHACMPLLGVVQAPEGPQSTSCHERDWPGSHVTQCRHTAHRKPAT